MAGFETSEGHGKQGELCRKSCEELKKPDFSSGKLIVVRGGGDIATGTIHRLWSAGFPVLVLECERPSAIRRQVSLCEAVYQGTAVVEGLEGVLIQSLEEIPEVLGRSGVPVLVDPAGESISALSPAVLVDGILAKRNLGTRRDMAELTIALGPGFEAGVDVDLVIETMRGHDLGRVIRRGFAQPDTGVPGAIGGYTKERVIHAEKAGMMRNIREIGDIVEQGEPIAAIVHEGGETVVPASISGVIRGLIRDGYPVTKGFKIADIDPRRSERKNCFTISDKARCIGGSVLEAVCAFTKSSHLNG
jgi:xanthine dehydrogenase accessory factor